MTCSMINLNQEILVSNKAVDKLDLHENPVDFVLQISIFHKRKFTHSSPACWIFRAKTSLKLLYSFLILLLKLHNLF